MARRHDGALGGREKYVCNDRGFESLMKTLVGFCLIEQGGKTYWG